MSIARIESELPSGARVVRAMPNTPALVRAGATAYAANTAATAADRALAQSLFECAGLAWEAPEESLLDAVTGLSGSGPAYVFVFLEALADAGVRVGLPRDVAQRLAIQTVLGAAQLARDTGIHPAQLRERVTFTGRHDDRGAGPTRGRGLSRGAARRRRGRHAALARTGWLVGSARAANSSRNRVVAPNCCSEP